MSSQGRSYVYFYVQYILTLVHIFHLSSLLKAYHLPRCNSARLWEIDPLMEQFGASVVSPRGIDLIQTLFCPEPGGRSAY